MDQHLGPFDVLEEPESHPGAFAGTFDDAGDVRHDEAIIPDTYDTKIWIDRREMVVGDLWLRF